VVEAAVEAKAEAEAEALRYGGAKFKFKTAESGCKTAEKRWWRRGSGSGRIRRRRLRREQDKACRIFVHLFTAETARITPRASDLLKG